MSGGVAPAPAAAQHPGTDLVALVAATPSPSPAGTRPPDELIGPGITGFVVIFFVAVALFFLARDMTRRLRRLRLSQETGTPPEAPGTTRPNGT